MNDVSRFVVFTLDQRRFGVPLESVERVVQVVEVTPVPQAPAAVLGVINFQGVIVPVFNVRERLGLPAREMQINDFFLIARTQARAVALLADEVTGVETAETAAAPVPPDGFVESMGQHDSALLFICDIERFLSTDEQMTLNSSVTAMGTRDD